MAESDNESGLESVELILVALLARGETVEASANIAGVSARTVYRRLADPDFKAKVAEFRVSMFSSVTGRLLDALPTATDTLQSLLEQEDDPQMQYKAAVKLIELAFKTREIDIKDRDVVKLQVIGCTVNEKSEDDTRALPDKEN